MSMKTDRDMGGHYAIRRATLADKEDVARLTQEFTTEGGMTNQDASRNIQRDFTSNLSSWFDCILLVYKPTNDLSHSVGFAMWSYGYFPYKGRYAELTNLYVSPKHQGKSLGYHLIQSVAKIIRSKGCQRLRWSTSATNHGAKTFYAKIKAENLARKGVELLQLVDQNFIDLAAGDTNRYLTDVDKPKSKLKSKY
ncbi:thialysine N-epsilon-acetyltransferase-like isoform X1 [Apostichopus japonicus]|uniref:thialysine N-epsilon-acetyltransferase-like isoform X1 n=1 Tax=Stichopus japonicus TaxID=307972 RepID=UPI003AB2B7DE